MIDFSKRISVKASSKTVNPIDLYEQLDRKSAAGPLRPAQEEILQRWFSEHKSDKDLIIKLHTGEGKTLIGLLILQSYLNADEGPCLYVCPNIFLLEQVCADADKFGIPYCRIGEDNILPDDFQMGKKILIVNAHKVFNGKSIFGTGGKSFKVGAIVLDDAHASIDILKSVQSFCFKKNENESLYNQFFALFGDDICEQGEGTYFDIRNGSSGTFALVPYWSWYEKKSEVLRILSEDKTTSSLQFVWPLMKDHITDYACYLGADRVEICPYLANVNTFGSFSYAKHRILMSATTQEDAFFVKGFGFCSEAVMNPLMYQKQKWSGEKMVIIPSMISDECTREWVIASIKKIKHNEYGVVVIVPNEWKMGAYRCEDTECAERDNVFEIINNLKNHNFGKIVVINNRYDGIDLPDEACRILVLDSLPGFSMLSDKYEQECRPASDLINKKIAQRIEQGMGRGVRGDKDYCAILIIGADLVKFVRSIETRKHLSNQTRKQIEIGLELAKYVTDDLQESMSPMEQVYSVVNQMLQRDSSWKAYYVENMKSIEDNTISTTLYSRLSEEASIEKLFSSNEYEKAATEMQKYLDRYDMDDSERGWYLQQMARYYYPVMKDKSNDIQKAAFRKNAQVLKPRGGIEYKKAVYIYEGRMRQIKNYLSRFVNQDEMVLSIHEIVDNLSFGVSAERFESSVMEIGKLLGFESQRPDHDFRKGFDNLWCGPNSKYCLFECKSEVLESRDYISKDEAGQMDNHCAWFEEQYGNQVTANYFWIAPTNKLSYYANLSTEVRIIRANKLNSFKRAIKGFISEISKYVISDLSEEKIQQLIDAHKLNMDNLRDDFSENFVKQMKV